MDQKILQNLCLLFSNNDTLELERKIMQFDVRDGDFDPNVHL